MKLSLLIMNSWELWMEADRMHNAVINQVGVDTQREVVKEEKRQNLDSRPYGNRLTALYNNLFTKHPYTWIPIGSMEDLDSAKLEEFQGFYKKYYVPNNATLVVAGDIKPEQTKSGLRNTMEGFQKVQYIPKIIQKMILLPMRKRLLLSIRIFRPRSTLLHTELRMVKKEILMF